MSENDIKTPTDEFLEELKTLAEITSQPILDSIASIPNVAPQEFLYILDREPLYPILKKYLDVDPTGIDVVVCMQWDTLYPNVLLRDGKCMLDCYPIYKEQGIEPRFKQSTVSDDWEPVTILEILKQCVLQDTANPEV